MQKPKLIALFLLIGFSFVAYSDENLKIEITPFVVSKSSKDKSTLYEVFELIRWKEKGYDLHEIRGTYQNISIHPSNKIREQYYYARFRKGDYLSGEFVMELTKNLVKSKELYPDWSLKDRVKSRGWIDTGKEIEWLDEKGKKITSQLYKHWTELRKDEGFLMTKKEFLENLKKGKTYEVAVNENILCPIHARKFKYDVPENIIDISSACSSCNRGKKKLLKVTWK